MSQTIWTGAISQKTNAEIAKNYLSQKGITTLNHIVSLYLDFAELQAEEHCLIFMKDRITILNDFLHILRKDTLTHTESILAKLAKAKAKLNTKYDKFKE